MIFYYSLAFGLLTLLIGTKGDVVLVGGGLEDGNTEIWSKVIELAGGAGVAKIGCICTASSDPEGSGVYYEDMFKSYGALSATYIPITETSNNTDDPVIVALLNEQTGFFFGGGDQGRIFKAWKRENGTDTLALSAVRDIVNGGGVVGGTSAGATCQGTGPMIEGGLSWHALTYGASPTCNPLFPDRLCYIENGGLGFVPNYLVDSHYSERGREGRLTKLLLETGNTLAIALDENTGVHIDANGNCQVLGADADDGGVMIVDVSEAVETAGDYTTVNSVKLSFFTQDDQFSLNGGANTIASWKTNLAGNEYYILAVSSDDIFSSPYATIDKEGEFRRVAVNLFDSKQDKVNSTTFETNPQYTVRLRKSASIGYGGYAPNSGPFKYSYEDMPMDISYS